MSVKCYADEKLGIIVLTITSVEMVGRKVIEEAKIPRAGSDSEEESQESRTRTGSRWEACCAPPRNVFNDTNPGKDKCDETDLCSWVNKRYAI